MTILEWHVEAMAKLHKAGVDSPRRDTLVFIEGLLGKDRAWVVAHPEHKLTSDQINKLDRLVKRRIKREPLAYIRGKAWFYGRFFNVSPDVLVPRPETENFIDIIKELKPKTVIDVGTGSGCLAVTTKLELPQASVIAIDINKKALETASQNAKKHNVEVRFGQGNMLEPIANQNMLTETAILANLPYVGKNRSISPEVDYEPKIAWSSGEKGLDHYKEFWQQVAKLSRFPKYVLTESLQNQHKVIEKLANGAGYKLQKTENLIQLFSLK